MSEKEPNKKALAILALPMGTSFGIGMGMMFGSVAGSIPIGLCFGTIGGSVIELIFLIILLSIEKKKDK